MRFYRISTINKLYDSVHVVDFSQPVKVENVMFKSSYAQP